MASKEEKAATLVSKSLMKDLNAPSAFPYHILPPQTGGLVPQSLLTGCVNGRVGYEVKRGWHKEQAITPLCYVYFSASLPRRFELQAFIYNPGLVSIIHRLAYAIPLARSIPGPVGLMDPHFTAFSGDPATAARLNSNPEILRLAEQVAVTERADSERVMRIDRCLHLFPLPGGSVLIVHTLPKTLMTRETLMGSEVMQLAAWIEASL